MCEDKVFRIIIKKISGVPTIPVSTDHRNGDWLPTDIYEGEQVMDVDTGIVYTRNGASIEAVGGGRASRFKSITYSELLALTLASSLTSSVRYYISDRGIILVALNSNTLSKEGSRIMRIVKNTYYTVAGANLGVWNVNLTPSVNDIVVWGGKCWSNVSGNIGASIDNTALDSEWTLIVTTNNTYYEDKTFFVIYDVANDIVTTQMDDRRNVFKSNIDICDWGNENIIDNYCAGGIYNNSNNDLIASNKCSGIFLNFNSGYIQQNIGIMEIYGNGNNGFISLNTDVTSINFCENNGNITHNRNNGQISSIGSANDNIQYNINNGDITTTTTGDIADTIVNK